MRNGLGTSLLAMVSPGLILLLVKKSIPPMVCPEALGVGPPSLGSVDSALMGELMPSAPALAAGEDWKKSGEEAGGSCDCVVPSVGGCREFCDAAASLRSCSSGP